MLVIVMIENTSKIESDIFNIIKDFFDPEKLKYINKMAKSLALYVTDKITLEKYEKHLELIFEELHAHNNLTNTE